MWIVGVLLLASGALAVARGERKPAAKSDPSIIKGTVRIPKGPREDPFRFLDYQQRWPGQALQEVHLHFEGTEQTFEVIYLGQVHRAVGPAEPGMRTILVRYLRELEAWPETDSAPLGCISFGDGPTTREATFSDLSSPEPALDRFLATIRIDSLQVAYLGELARYATDEPSLAAGTIDQMMRQSNTGALTMDERLFGALNQIAIDRTVRPLVRDAATAALATFGRTPVIARAAEPDSKEPHPKKPPPAAPDTRGKPKAEVAKPAVTPEAPPEKTTPAPPEEPLSD